MTSRDTILARIREAMKVQAPAPGHGDHPISFSSARRADKQSRSWLPAVGSTQAEWIAQFEKNAVALKAECFELPNQGSLQTKLSELRDIHGWKRAAVQEIEPVLSAASSMQIPLLRISAGYSREDLENCDVGITVCDALIAQTGSILLTTRSGGGRALSVLPHHHVVIARREQMLPDLPAAYDLLHERYGSNWPSMMTFITGPSRTGDIERILILGAHGPKRLSVLIV